MSILLSTSPNWCYEIIKGNKRVDVRKTRPTIKTPFKVFLYCTYGQVLYEDFPNGRESREIKLGDFKVGKSKPSNILNGKVIGEFICTGIIGSVNSIMSKLSLLSMDELTVYQGKAKTLYGWRIANLKIYDKPKELSEFKYPCRKDEKCCLCKYHNFWDKECNSRPTRPPQSWCYVEE